MEDAHSRAEAFKVLTANEATSSGQAREEIIDQAVFNSFIPHIIDSCEKCPECNKEMCMELPPLIGESKCALWDMPGEKTS
eukprot:4625559-Karenia_brevis.AAC.1